MSGRGKSFIRSNVESQDEKNHFRSDENGIATDPNSIKVGGDIKMDLDLNEAIKEDAKLQEAAD